MVACRRISSSATSKLFVQHEVTLHLPVANQCLGPKSESRARLHAGLRWQHMFDPELLRGLQGPLAPYQALADRTVVHRAILAQMRYVADVAASLPQTSHSTSGGLFRFTWRLVKS